MPKPGSDCARPGASHPDLVIGHDDQTLSPILDGFGPEHGGQPLGRGAAAVVYESKHQNALMGAGGIAPLVREGF